jgi:hypothetical protein
MNRFDREFWDGARESALAIYTAVEGRQDVPSDVRQLVRRVLIEAGERKNRDFREDARAEALNLRARLRNGSTCRRVRLRGSHSSGSGP